MKSSKLLMTAQDLTKKTKPKEAKHRNIIYSGISKPWIEEMAPRMSSKSCLISEERNLRHLSEELLVGMNVDSFLPLLRVDALRLRK